VNKTTCRLCGVEFQYQITQWRKDNQAKPNFCPKCHPIGNRPGTFDRADYIHKETK
jgi:hypothetical protein